MHRLQLLRSQRHLQASIVTGVVTTADSSAMVKFGSSSVLAAVKLELFGTAADAPDQGRLQVLVEMAPLCSSSTRPGRPSRAASSIQVRWRQEGTIPGRPRRHRPVLLLPSWQEHVSRCLIASGAMDQRQLSIAKGVSAWVAYLDMYVLDADGSLHDVALAAAVAALQGLKLPAVTVNDDGYVLPPGQAPPGSRVIPERAVGLAKVPLSLTCGVFGAHFLADPTAFEESLVHTTVTVALDGAGALVGMFKPGGVDVDLLTLQACIEAAKLRHKELSKLLQA